MNLPDPLVVGVRDHDLGHAIEKPASYGFCKTRWNSIGFISYDLSRSKKRFGVSTMSRSSGWWNDPCSSSDSRNYSSSRVYFRDDFLLSLNVWDCFLEASKTVGRGLHLVWFGSEKWILFFVFSLFLSDLYVELFKNLILFDLIWRSKYCYPEGYLYLRDFYLLLFRHFFGIVRYILLWLWSYATWLGKMTTIIYDKVWFSPFFYFIILPQLQMMYIAEICIPVLINLGLLGKPTSHFQD